MGSNLEINDTLQITTEQGFPADVLDLVKHKQSLIELNDVDGKVFEFSEKSGARKYHSPPTRNFLVHNINGKWLYWGHVLVIKQIVDGDNEGNLRTSGKFRIIKIYDLKYQELITRNESPLGLSYFD